MALVVMAASIMADQVVVVDMELQGMEILGFQAVIYFQDIHELGFFFYSACFKVCLVLYF